MKIEIEAFLELAKTIPVVDVRSPSEYLRGHIPGAVNIPLFTDNERTFVGTTYKQKSREKAILAGLDIVGPKMRAFVEKAKELSNSELLLYCWRGGMRSESMAWLFNLYGIKATTLKNGYKAYRKHIRSRFAEKRKILILGGLTGSGKTEILHELAKNGHQILDLEGIANHKGSAFGALGQIEQPSNEQFENLIAEKWLNFNKEKVIWIEDESHSIGSVWLPDPLFEKMRASKVVQIECKHEERIQRLVKDYAQFPNEKLEHIIQKIGKRLGGQNVKKAIEALKKEDYHVVAEIVLAYYDKTYSFGLNKRDKNSIVKLNTESLRMTDIIKALKEKEASLV